MNFFVTAVLQAITTQFISKYLIQILLRCLNSFILIIFVSLCTFVLFFFIFQNSSIFILFTKFWALQSTTFRLPAACVVIPFRSRSRRVASKCIPKGSFFSINLVQINSLFSNVSSEIIDGIFVNADLNLNINQCLLFPITHSDIYHALFSISLEL